MVSKQENDYFKIILDDSKKMCEKLWIMKNNHELCDAEVIVNGERISVHSNVLAACSEYFRNMFLNCSLSEVIFDNVDKKSITDIIEYFYTGYLEINENNVEDLGTMANILSIATINEKLKEIPKKNDYTVDCTTKWKIVEIGRIERIKSTICKSDSKNLEEYSKTNRFLSLKYSELLELLGSVTSTSDLVIYNAIKDWINYDSVSRNEYMTGLLDFIHFESLSEDVLIKDLILCGSNKECYEKLIKGIQLSRDSKSSRNYTLMAVGSQNFDDPRVMEIFDATKKKWIEVFEYNIKRRYFSSVLLNNKLILFGGKIPKVETITNTVESYDLETRQIRTLSSMKYPRFRTSAVLLDSDVFVIGGYNEKPIPYVEKYDTITNSWKEVASLFIPRNGCGAQIIQGEIYVVGGFGGPKNNEFLSSLEIYNPKTNKWRKRAPMNERREAPGVAVVDNVLYAVGGWNDFSIYSSTAEMYNLKLDKWTMIQSMNEGRYWSAAAVLNGKLLIGGGNVEDTGEDNSIVLYDRESNTWKEMEPLNVSRTEFNFVAIPIALANIISLKKPKTMIAIGSTSYSKAKNLNILDIKDETWLDNTIDDIDRRKFTSVLLNENAILLIGGEFKGKIVNTVQSLDLLIDKLKSLPGLIYPRYQAASVICEGSVYVIGGADENDYFSSVEKRNQSNGSWKEVASMTSSRKSCGAVTLDGKIYAIGGYSDIEGFLSSVEMYDPTTDRWNNCESMMYKRKGPAVAVVGKYIYVAGGYSKKDVQLKSAERYNPYLNQWREIKPMKTARAYCAGGNYLDNFLVAGGETNKPVEFLETVEIYNENNDDWEYFEELRDTRKQFNLLEIGLEADALKKWESEL